MADWIRSLVDGGGYLTIAFLMFLENVFPPIPSEVIMPLAGSSATDGRLSIIGVIAAGSAGSLAGALLWYAIGRKLEDERIKRWSAKHGRWLTLDQMTSKKPRTGSENTAQRPSSLPGSCRRCER